MLAGSGLGTSSFHSKVLEAFAVVSGNDMRTSTSFLCLNESR